MILWTADMDSICEFSFTLSVSCHLIIICNLKNRLFSCIGYALKTHSKHNHVTAISSRTLTAPLISGVEPFVKF